MEFYRSMALRASGMVLAMLLGGCASTIRSDVTTFHQWSAAPPDKTYVFEAAPAPDDTLALRSYQDLVRRQLTQLGFQDVGASGAPGLKVSLRVSSTDVPVRVLQPVEPLFYPTARFNRSWGPYPHRRSYWGGYYSPLYDPFYDPFWFRRPVYEEHIEHQVRRELHIAITSAADGKRLFDVTVHNLSGQLSTPAIMPALVQSAFVGFPGPNGGARRIELKQAN